ncbi:MAG: class GN sortase [Limibacillus sp.]|jgi:sortase A
MNPPRPPALAQPLSPRRVLLGVTAALLLGLGVWQLGGAGWLTAKAWLSQVLIAQAWGDVVKGGEARPPWPWADTHPVAKLEAPALGVTRYVLADTGGTSLAFGPGLIPGSAKPGSAERGGQGHSVIAGHRDSHFAFLEDLEAGQPLILQGPDGRALHYRVKDGRVVDLREGAFTFDPTRRAVTLVTCWPFGALDPATPYRYLVTAEAID